MNVAAIYHGLLCIFRPSLLRPSLVYEEFSDIPANISEALTLQGRVSDCARPNRLAKVDIRAIVLDKDNCFAAPHAQTVWPAYQTRWHALRSQFPGEKLLIVSNSAGSSDDANKTQAAELAENLKTRVLHHKHKKPACATEVMQALQSAAIGVDNPAQVVVIGDRLFTDVLLANLMGSHSIWLRRGTVANFGLFSRMEKAIYNMIQ